VPPYRRIQSSILPGTAFPAPSVGFALSAQGFAPGHPPTGGHCSTGVSTLFPPPASAGFRCQPGGFSPGHVPTAYTPVIRQTPLALGRYHGAGILARTPPELDRDTGKLHTAHPGPTPQRESLLPPHPTAPHSGHMPRRGNRRTAHPRMHHRQRPTG